jgi:glutaredoxin
MAAKINHSIVAALFSCLIVLALSGGALDGVALAAAKKVVTLHFFWGEGCPHCERAKPFLRDLERKYPALQIESLEVLEHRENIPKLLAMAKNCKREATGVPVFIIGERMLSGFAPETAIELDKLVRESLDKAVSGNAKGDVPETAVESLNIPLIGKVDCAAWSLPVFTIVIAGLDSFNPCAFFVLFFLLSLLIHAHSRRRMLLIGGVFIMFSGLIYFVFMAAWLNMFLLVGTLPVITVTAGVVALLVAIINIKDFFFFEKGVSLVIPEGKKPQLFARMRRLLKAESLVSMVGGTAVLAVAANSYELLCTAGFPMVFTRMLTLQQLPTLRYYLYLAFYNLVYIVPLAIIVAVFTVTLGSRKLSEWQGQVLKLVSGLMMLGLALVLLVKPALLNSPLVSVLLLGATIAVATLLATVVRKYGRRDA